MDGILLTTPLTQPTIPQTQHRPQTSKPRGICRYYDTPRGCFAGDHCKFLHGKPPDDPESSEPPLLSPYDQAKKCRFYIQGYCKRGDSCWFRHVSDDEPSSSKVTIESDDEDTCSICFEKATTFGLLGGCSHVFCITCIKQWRDPQNRPGGTHDSENTKKCPMCRTPSKFITPSSRFYKQGTEEKDKVVAAYKESMSRVPCRYFQKALKSKSKPSCPYGKDCFYQHKNEDGTDYVFQEGVDVSMRRYRSQTSRHRHGYLRNMFIPFSFETSDIPFGIDGEPTPFMDADPRQASAIRRLRDVRDMLTDALSENAPLENLQEAVEALRNGLGRLEDLNWNQERPAEESDEAASRHEDEVMVHLEFMADQMLTALNALGGHEGGGRGWGASTPHEIDSSEGGQSDTQHEAGYTSASSVSSMPALQSVSNSSSEASDDEEENDDDDSDVDLPASTSVQGQREFLRTRERSFTSLMAEADRIQSPATPAARSETPPPALTSPSQPSSSITSDSVEEESRESSRNNSDGPFVTDGRGRVVGTNNEVKRGSSSSSNSVEEGESNGQQQQEGWLGWFHSLF
ncbi:hypothetical protein BJ165DRAFT_1438195 [Panaeolus papilionaceus]|nr:hypothetical protein BJ165DRAFT_1438195 [Panaeolus papilionaceus]